jgi:hypothetical protein
MFIAISSGVSRTPELSIRNVGCHSGVAAQLSPVPCPTVAGDGPVHDPEVYLFDYVPPELRIEVGRLG